MISYFLFFPDIHLSLSHTRSFLLPNAHRFISIILRSGLLLGIVRCFVRFKLWIMVSSVGVDQA